VTKHSERGSIFRSRKFMDFPTMKESLIAREIDATFMVVPLAMKLAEDGLPVKIVYLGHRDGTTIMVGKDSEITDFGGLRGRKVAIPSRYSNQHLLMRRMMKKHHMEDGSIELLEMAPPDMPAALAAKAIDAFIVGEPHPSRAEMEGFGRVLYFTKDIWPNFISCALVVRQELIDERREIVQELVDGIAASGEWLDESIEHRHDAAEVVGRVYYNQDPEMLRWALTKPLDRVKYTQLAPLKPNFDEIMALAVETGVLKGRLSFDDYVDTSFVPPLERVDVPLDRLPMPKGGEQP
jgi:NitT/TauT family transport system substrate-binding protein